MKTRLWLHNLMIAAIVVVASASFGLLTGCEDRADSPRDVVNEFLDQLRAGERQQAMELIWPETRQKLEASYRDLEDYYDGDPPMDKAQMLLVTRVENPMVITRVRTEEAVPEDPADGERVRVNIELRDDRTAYADVRFSQQQGRWFVDLPMDDRRPLRVSDDEKEESSGGDSPDDEEDHGDEEDHDDDD